MRRVIGGFLLAILCIGGSELAVCRYAEPELYQQITAPVRARVTMAAAELSAAGERLVNRLRPVETVLFAFGSMEEGEYASDSAVWGQNDRQEPLMTALKETEEGDVLTGGSWEVTYYEQTDPQWRDRPYGSDTIGKYGCGPTVMAMAVSTLSGYDIDPGEMALWAGKHGYWAKKNGSYLSIVQGTAKAYGLSAVSARELSPEHLIQELSAGKLAVALMGKGHFTDGGHFILLRGVTLGGEVLVADSASRERSLTAWDPQQIIDELSGSRGEGAPLWYLSVQSQGL